MPELPSSNQPLDPDDAAFSNTVAEHAAAQFTPAWELPPEMPSDLEPARHETLSSIDLEDPSLSGLRPVEPSTEDLQVTQKRESSRPASLGTPTFDPFLPPKSPSLQPAAPYDEPSVVEESPPRRAILLAAGTVTVLAALTIAYAAVRMLSTSPPPSTVAPLPDDLARPSVGSISSGASVQTPRPDADIAPEPTQSTSRTAPTPLDSHSSDASSTPVRNRRPPATRPRTRATAPERGEIVRETPF